MTTQIRQQNGIAILEPTGKIVGPSVSELREAIAPQIEASDTPRILINFEHVNKIDSSGLVALMTWRHVPPRNESKVVSALSMSANTSKIWWH